MRLSALAACMVLAGCGRLGYDELAGGDAADGPPAIDAPDGPPAGVLFTCDTATEVIDFGDTGGAAATFYALDVAATDVGFLVVWSAGGGDIVATGLALNDGPRLENIQTASQVVNAANGTISVSAIGDDAMLGVDDPAGPGIDLFALDFHGYGRADAKYIDGYRAAGHDFVTADASRDEFVVMGGNGASVAAFTRDHDIHPLNGPVPSFPVASESAAAAVNAGGYTLITGNSSNCDVRQVTTALTGVGMPQPISMTCHNATVVQVPDSPNVVAAWNCDNDQVWTIGGDPASPLPAYHAIYGDSTNVSSSPRLAVTSDGIWYGFKVGTDRLGRALLDGASNAVSGAEGAVMHTSATLKAYDLAAARNGYAFLFWLDVDTSTKLMAMKLCPP